VRAWKTDDVLPALDKLANGRSLEAGQKAFRDTGCAQCHRCAGEGGTVGPDLSDLSKRLAPREIVESVIEPSKKIADQYATWLVETDDGQVLSGRIEREDDSVLVLRQTATDAPPVAIEKSQIVGRRKSDTSNMPAGIINVLHEHELLDLLAYLLAPREP
jgi:putative heme-binding domain-containing protein